MKRKSILYALMSLLILVSLALTACNTPVPATPTMEPVERNQRMSQ